MELSQLRYVVMLAEVSNFSKAAEKLFVTQPALSQQISALEDELGVKLFRRTTRKVCLTDAGVCFVQHAKKVIEDMETLEQAMRLRSQEVSGSLSVGLLSTLSHLNIPEYLSAFSKAYPNIRVNLKIAWSNELIDQVIDQSLDAAITNIYYPQVKKLSQQLNTMVFSEDQIVVVASNKRDFGGKEILGIEDLKDIPIIALEPITSIRMEMDHIFSAHHIIPKIVCVCPAMDSLIAMVRADMGVTMLSSGVANAYLSRSLVKLYLDPPFRTRTALITRKSTDRTSPLMLFEDYFFGITH
ncbi:MAG: LysR family transcriptional regulator [Oscillospiraceae bacterium]|nr:LysR family transcriptional regulator [Oscillospiraceae bacterium]